MSRASNGRAERANEKLPNRSRTVLGRLSRGHECARGVDARDSSLQASPPLQTPWGDPDSQGLWLTLDRTPFERNATHSEFQAAIDEAEKTRYGAEGRGEGFGGGMSSIDFTPRSPRRAGYRVVDPPDGRVPIKPEEVHYQIDRRGVTRAMGDHWKNHIPLVRCLSEGFALSGVYRLLQSPGYVVILSERIHDARIIPVDGRSHVNSTIRQWNGDFARPLGRPDAGCRDDQLQQRRRGKWAVGRQRPMGCAWWSASDAVRRDHGAGRGRLNTGSQCVHAPLAGSSSRTSGLRNT